MKYDLVGIDGNAFNIISYVINAMKECGFSTSDMNDYFKEATSSDYSHLIVISYDMISRCNEIADDILISKL